MRSEDLRYITNIHMLIASTACHCRLPLSVGDCLFARKIIAVESASIGLHFGQLRNDMKARRHLQLSEAAAPKYHTPEGWRVVANEAPPAETKAQISCFCSFGCLG